MFLGPLQVFSGHAKAEYGPSPVYSSAKLSALAIHIPLVSSAVEISKLDELQPTHFKPSLDGA